MSLGNPKNAYNNIAEYQISGLPWVTQSLATSAATRIDFPHVTQGFSIKNTGTGSLLVGFTQNGINGSNRFSLTTSGSFTGDFRIKTLFVKSDTINTTYELIASLTLVLHKNAPTLTGSAIYPSGSANGQIYEYGYGLDGSVMSGSGLG